MRTVMSTSAVTTSNTLILVLFFRDRESFQHDEEILGIGVQRFCDGCRKPPSWNTYAGGANGARARRHSSAATPGACRTQVRSTAQEWTSAILRGPLEEILPCPLPAGHLRRSSRSRRLSSNNCGSTFSHRCLFPRAAKRRKRGRCSLAKTTPAPLPRFSSSLRSPEYNRLLELPPFRSGGAAGLLRAIGAAAAHLPDEQALATLSGIEVVDLAVALLADAGGLA